MDESFAPLQPVVIEGLPVEWVSTRGEDGERTVLVCNHDGHPWRGKVTVKNMRPDQTLCRDLLSGEDRPFQHEGRNVTIELKIAPYDLAILRWTREQANQ